MDAELEAKIEADLKAFIAGLFGGRSAIQVEQRRQDDATTWTIRLLTPDRD